MILNTILVFSLFVFVTGIDVTCRSRRTRRHVMLGVGEVSSFRTQSGTEYGSGVDCKVTYKRSSRSDCKLSISCGLFDITNTRSTCSKREDYLSVNNRRYCNSKVPEEYTTRKTNMKVQFISKSFGGNGALCFIECVSNNPTTTMEPTTMVPTTMPATTMPATTWEPTTIEPTTMEPTTMEPTTMEATTVEPVIAVTTTSQAPITTTVGAGSNQNETFTNDQFCAFSQGHTMCKYPGEGSKCLADQNRISGFTQTGRDEILNQHNFLRSKVAKGEEDGQPKATNMRALVWNNELEVIAQRWADQCTFGHDEERGKLDGTSVGQNAFSAWSSRISSKEEMMAKMSEVATAWYNEVTDPGFSASKISPYEFSSGVGHYTQVVWAETEEIGCGWSYFNDASMGYQQSLVICNYGEAGNMIGGSMYEEGATCTNCPAGYSCDSQQLCEKI